MALTATGFPGTVNSVEQASIARGYGSLREVEGPDDFEVTIAPGDRTVQIAPGVAHAGGVRVVNDAPSTLQLDPVDSGSRWDLVSLRRKWSGSGTVTVEKVPGTNVEAIPLARETSLGAIDDQMLALVQVTAGQSAPEIVRDYRIHASKVMDAKHREALPRLKGAEAVVEGVRYRCHQTVDGLVWVNQDLPIFRDLTAIGGAGNANVSIPVEPGAIARIIGVGLAGQFRPPVGVLNVTVATKLVATGSSAGNVWCETSVTGSRRFATKRWHFETSHSAVVTFDMRVPASGEDVSVFVQGSVDGAPAAPVIYGQPRISVQSESYGGAL